jgi:hypothetical protein
MVTLRQHSTELHITNNRCSQYRQQLSQYFTLPKFGNSPQIPVESPTHLMTFGSVWSGLGMADDKINTSARDKPNLKRMGFIP